MDSYIQSIDWFFVGVGLVFIALLVLLAVALRRQKRVLQSGRLLREAQGGHGVSK